MPFKLSIISKLTVLVVAAVSLTALAVSEINVRGTNQILIDRAINDLKEEARFFRYPLNNRLERLKNDIVLMAQLPAMQAMARAAAYDGIDPLTNKLAVEYKEQLGQIFVEMMRTRSQYLQLRFIGVANNGKEVLRVDRFGNRVERMPENKLQPKGDEPYFRGTMRLAPGDIYFSEPDLYKEVGKVQIPHVLVLRAAVPIFTPEREPFGFVIVNIDFGAALQSIRQSIAGDHAFSITNASGSYLMHPDKSKLFASDLGHDDRIQRDEPRLLSVMGNPKQDEATLLPEDTGQGNVLSFLKYRYDPHNSENYMGIAVRAPYAEIIAKTKEVQQRGVMLGGIIALIAAVVGILLLRLLMRPLNRVADAILRYRKGERDLALPVDEAGEVGLLAREFAAMMEQKNKEDWIKENLVSVSRNLLGFKELTGFANSLMEALTPLVGAQVGVLYISGSFARRHGNGDAETLSLIGAWGYRAEEGKVLPRSFGWGEGVVGSCARTRTRMLIADVPDDYLTVATALGQTQPRQVLVLPVLFENTLVGVIELGTVGAFSAVQFSLLEQLSFNVGVIVNSIVASMRTQELLEESRRFTEELQRNEEELKTQQEELEASNEEMEEKTRALEEQNARISRQTRELEENKRLVQQKVAELERSNRYKSEFLANMSHELRTPLNSLLILARGLSLNEEGNLTEEQVEEARVILNGGLELLSLINDILDLSKVEAGKISIVPEDVHLRYVAEKIAQQFQPIAQEAGVAFDVRVEEDLPTSVHTDGQRLEQILKNLLSNAFKFTAKGSVTLEIHSAREGGPQRLMANGPAAIGFSVIDTGIGIEKAKLHDIFEAFQQEDGSTDRHYGGTGLGLTIARKFARLLGGEIHVASEKGKGSTFTLFLPPAGVAAVSAQDVAHAAITAAFAPQAAHPPAAVHEQPRSPVKMFIPDDRNLIGPNDKVLLIIEDDPDFGTTLMKIARRRGYRCLVAGDGKSGLLMAVERPVTAILLDLRLPDIDGMRVLDQLKHDLATRHIPVHIISGMDAPDGMAPMRKGAIGYLTKPVRQEDLDGVFGQIEAVLRSGLKRVLVVEDDKNTQTAIQSLLKNKQVEIVNACSGEAALEQMKAVRFDCIILDLKLPDMTGFEWLEAVEKERGPDTPPIIIYTARELSEDENRVLNRYTGSIVIKGASSSERLLDEVTLFLHSLEAALSKDQQAMIRMQHDPDKALHDRTVLLVDDDLRNTFALSKLLKKHGMKVVIADNGEMALEKLREEKAIELVIMDVMMPVMDGYQAMRAIRADAGWKRLPIIALTARAMPEEQDRCMEAGANDYLVKPVDIERLLTLLRVWLFKQEQAA